MAINFYNLYKIGDEFKNENGDTYRILAMDKESDKTVLFKTTEKHTPFYVGAHYMKKNHWGFGHYFMENAQAAFEWFFRKKEDEEEKKPKLFVSEIIDLLNEDSYDIWFYDETVDDGKYKKYYYKSDVPVEFLEAKVFSIELTTKNQFPNDEEFQLPVMIITVKSEFDPRVREFFDFGYTEGRYE